MKEQLSPDVYHIMYEKGTERPFSSPLNDEKRPGTFVSADTGLPLFRSEDKYDSGSGWPSFVKPIDGSVKLVPDNSLFMRRTEVLTADTGAHLGHVFDDGPADRGGKRYCINGLALRFVPDEEKPATPE
jgi:methionine-R-sulfoxide reductase